MGRRYVEDDAFLPDRAVDEFRDRLVHVAGMMSAEQVESLAEALMVVVRRKRPVERPTIDLHA